MRFSNNEESAGFTHYLDIQYSDFTETTDDTAQTFTYAVPAGTYVTKVAHVVKEEFNDSGGGDELTVAIGDGDDADGYIAANEIHTDGTVITYACNDGALLDNENGKLYTAADTIDITFTPNPSTGQSYALSELTAGKIRILIEMARLSDL